MEPRISLVTLGVKDLARAKTFYEEVVGWKAADGPPGIVFFDLGGLIFSLYPHDNLVKDHGGTAKTHSSSGFAIAHNARSREEVDAIFASLKEKGATIVKEPEEVFWGGYSGYFEDLDGHKWEVAYNPFWTILEDGRVSMSAGS